MYFFIIDNKIINREHFDESRFIYFFRILFIFIFEAIESFEHIMLIEILSD